MSSWLIRVGVFSAVIVLVVTCFAALRPAGGSPALLAHGEEGEEGLAETLAEQHVAVIHFPIALAIAAALAEVIALITRKPAFTHAARFCIIIAALGAIAAVVTGWLEFGEHAGVDDDNLHIHRILGLIAGPLIVAAAVLSEVGHIGRNKWVLLAYRIALLAAVVLVALTGYYGGKYVFG